MKPNFTAALFTGRPCVRSERHQEVLPCASHGEAEALSEFLNAREKAGEADAWWEACEPQIKTVVQKNQTAG